MVYFHEQIARLTATGVSHLEYENPHGALWEM